MTDLLPRGSFTQLDRRSANQNAPATDTQEGNSGLPLGGFEEEWQDKLCNLQMLVCELLRKNEQLRMTLGETTASGFAPRVDD